MVLAEELELLTESWPPYVETDDDGARGLTVDILEEALEPLGIDLVVREVPWKRALAMVERGDADGIFPLNRNQERETFLRFPENPLAFSEGVLFHSVDRPLEVGRLGDLAGMRVGLSSGYQYSGGLRETPGVFFEETPTDVLNFQKLAAGRIDVFPCDRLVGNAHLVELGFDDRITFHDRPLNRSAVFVGFSRARTDRDPELRALVDALSTRLRELVESGRHAAILEGWRATPSEQTEPLQP